MDSGDVKGSFGRNHLLRSLKDDPFLAAIVLFSLTLSVVFSLLSIMKYLSMNATGYDLGLFSQAFYSAIHGQLYYTNLLGESYLTEHFSPIVFLYTPIYYLWPSPATLLWIQGFAIGLAAIPLYLLSREWLRISTRSISGKAALAKYFPFVLSVSYLLSPMVSAPISFDFHLMTVLPLFFFMAFYFFLKKNRRGHAASLAMIVAIHSSFVIIVIFLLISEFLVFRSPKYYDRDSQLPLFSRKSLKYLAIYISLALALLAYFYLIATVKPIFSGFPASLTPPALRQAGSPNNSAVDVVLNLVLKPNIMLQYLLTNHSLKGMFIIFGFGTTGFLSILFPEVLITVIPYVLYAMFSTFPPYYTAGYQYSMMLVPMAYVAAAGGFLRLSTLRSGLKKELMQKVRKTAVAIMLSVIIIGTVIGFIYTPLSPPGTFHNPGSVSDMWQYQPNNASKFVEKVSKTIPQGAVLVTQNDVYPFFSQNMNSYETPWSPGMSSFNVTKFQYLIANYGSDWVYNTFPSMYSLINKALKTGQYGVYASGYGVLVLEKNFSSAPVYYVPLTLNMSTSSIYPAVNSSAYLIGNHVSISNSTNNSDFFDSAFNLIVPGTYDISVKLSTSNLSSGNKFTFNLTDSLTDTTLLSVRVSAASLKHADRFVELNYTFTSKYVYNDVAFTGSNVSWNGTASIGGITMRQVST